MGTLKPSTPNNGETKIRVKRKQRFATKPHEYVELKLKIFKDYCMNKLGHSKVDWAKLEHIFRHFIHRDNVHEYINTHSKDIYSGIFNGNLSDYSNKSTKP